jgi:hypothetical protein
MRQTSPACATGVSGPRPPGYQQGNSLRHGLITIRLRATADLPDAVDDYRRTESVNLYEARLVGIY